MPNTTEAFTLVPGVSVLVDYSLTDPPAMIAMCPDDDGAVVFTRRKRSEDGDTIPTSYYYTRLREKTG